MRKRPEPATLYDAALKHAADTLAYRQRELKAMCASLALLDELVPTLKAKGFDLYPSYLSWWPSDRAISLNIGLFSSAQRCRALFDALVGLGFKVVRHANVCSWSDAVLKRGRLALRITDLPPLPKPEPVTDADSTDQAAGSASA